MLDALSGPQPVFALISTRRVYDRLASIYLLIAIAVFVLVVVAVGFVVLRYRGASTVSRRSEHNPLEISYAVLLACVAGFLIYLALGAEDQVDTVADRERPNLRINVIAAKWEWQFTYPRYKITAESGYVGNQPLVVPINRAIRFNLRSRDVIHAIWIPELEFKRDLIPGAVEHVTLTFTRPGWFGGECAVFCGVHHPEMVFRVHAMSPAAFDRWAKQHERSAA